MHTLVRTAGVECKVRRTATAAAAWMMRAGRFIASAQTPVHAVVALGVGALRRYRSEPPMPS
jgi:hypothetical protein